MDSIVQPAATEQPSSSRNRLLLTVYTAAIFVSALLLFSVQPLFTKMVLPRLGGSPAVWSVAMVFFQSLLLAGYAYAHLLMQVRNRIVPVVVHLVLLALAFATLPLGIATAYLCYSIEPEIPGEVVAGPERDADEREAPLHRDRGHGGE